MATFKFQPLKNPDRTVISKKTMNRIIQIRDKRERELKQMLVQSEDENEELIKYMQVLKHERKRYLILSIVATIFGVVGLIGGVFG